MRSRCLLGVLLAGLTVLPACNRIELVRGLGRQRPNLLLVTIDTLRADHVGAYGAADASTPHLDRLAREGVRFETAIAPAPLTLPSHASILTGFYPPHHGVRHNGIHSLPPEAVTLAEVLAQAGYATAAVVGSDVLAARYGLAQGFQHYDDATSDEPSGPGGFRERHASEVTEHALEWLKRIREPWFLWVHYYDPHFTYRPPPPFSQLFRGRPYDGEVAYVDAELGRLFAALERQGVWNRTLVAVTADHGESLGEHLELTHSFTLYDATLRVPLLLRGPGIPAGRVVSGVVRTVDLAPTLARQAGVRGLPAGDGEDLAPLWAPGAPASSRWAYAETIATRVEFGWSPLFAIRTRDRLYVRAPRPELYDLTSDPTEQVNLLAAGEAAAERSARELDARVDAILAGARRSRELALDETSRAALARLGYLIPERELPATNRDPKDGLRDLALFNRANEAYAAKDYARAEKLLKQALKKLPESPKVHALLGFTYLATSRFAQARDELARSVELFPAAPYNRAMLGEALRQLGDEEAAEEQYRAAAKLDPHEPNAQVGLVWVSLRHGDLAGAEAHAREALASAPHSAMVRVQLGTVWERFQRHDRALRLYREAVRLDRHHELAQMMLAIELARASRWDESDAHRARAGALARDPWLATGLGIASAEGGDLLRARRVLEAVLKARPGYRPAERVLAKVLRELGLPQEASRLEHGKTPPAAPAPAR